jgi:nitroreductase
MADVLLDPYGEAIGEFPLTGTPEEQLRAVVKYAVRAPSSHNTQPWLFRVAANEIALYADRSRGLPVVDPDDRELVISCGATLFHLRLALRHFGCGETVVVLPDPDDPNLLARVRLQGSHEPTDEEHALFGAIPRRRTTRLPFPPRPIAANVLAALAAAAAPEGAWLHFLAAPRLRDTAADLVAQGDRLQMTDPHFRRELAAWLRPNWSDRGDGMPGFAFGFGDVMAALGPLVVRTFDVGEGRAARNRELALGSPALAVLGTAADGVRDWLAAGQALARVLLRAEVAGVTASFLNQPIEVPELRPSLQGLVGGTGYPQMLLRLGYKSQKTLLPTPRRPAEQVLIEEPAIAPGAR